jgi:hypothetical protein
MQPTVASQPVEQNLTYAQLDFDNQQNPRMVIADQQSEPIYGII